MAGICRSWLMTQTKMIHRPIQHVLQCGENPILRFFSGQLCQDVREFWLHFKINVIVDPNQHNSVVETVD